MALAERDLGTHDHSDRVGQLSLALGQACGLTSAELKQLALAARFHDIGKIGIPDRVLLKPGVLDAEERALMSEHCERGARIFLSTERQDAACIAAIIRGHHEAWDGSGYPDQLAGEAIPLLARIVRVADSYDAMISARPYQRPRAHAQVMHILQQERERKLDPAIFDHFTRLIAHHPWRSP